VIFRTSRALFKIAGFAAFVFVVATLVLGLRLSAGPIALDFLKKDVEAALSAEDGAYQIRMEKLLLTWEGIVGGLGFVAITTRITDAEGDLLGDVPKVRMGLSFRALLYGTLAPTHIWVEQPTINLLRRLDGPLEAKAGDAAAEGAAVAVLMAGLLGTSLEASPLDYLSEFRLIGAKVTIDDQVLETAWWLPRTDLHLYRDNEEISGDYAVEVEHRNERARFTGGIHYRNATEILRVGVDFHDIEPAMFAIEALPFDHLSGLKLPVSGGLVLSLFPDGRLKEVALDISSKKGRIVIPGVYDDGLEIAFANLSGTIDGDLRHGMIKDFFVDLGGPTIKAALRESREGEKLLFNGDVEIFNMPVDDLPKYWPKGAAENAREWIGERLSFGHAKETRAVFSASLDMANGLSLDVTELKGWMSYSGIDVVYVPDFPRVVGAEGTGTFDLESLSLALTAGTHEGLSLTEGRVRLFGLDGEDHRAEIDVTASGPLRSALDTLDHSRLRYLQKMGLTPDRFEGKASVRVLFQFPLLEDLSFDDLEVGGEATLRDLSFKDALPDVHLRKGEVTIKLEGSLLSMSGQAEIAGAPAAITWQENFSENAAFQSRYTLKSQMGDRTRETFGYSGAPFLHGPAGVDLVYTSRNGEGKLAIDLDLAPSELRVPGFAWTKPAGVPGKGKVEIEFDKKGKLRRVRKLTITAEDMEARGAILFSSDGKTMKQIRLERLKFGATDVEGKATRESDGSFDVNLVGRGLDAERLLEQNESDSDLPPMKLAAVMDHVRLGPGQKIDRVVGSMEYDGKHWRSMLLDGIFEKQGTMKLTVKPDGKVRRLTVTSDAGGTVLEALGLMENLRGGALVISGTFHDDEEPKTPLRGRIKMKNFHAVDVPVLGKLLVVASLTGAVDMLKGKGVEFTRLNVPFTSTQTQIHLDQGRAFGPSIGITFAGKVDKEKDVLDVRGTIVPAYTINRLLGKIPLIGNILIGGEGEGVFAVNYKVEGSREDPKVSVNPLSALAPGFLRKFFDVFEEELEGAPAPPSAAPGTAPDATP